MITVREYLDDSGESPFREWFLSLDLHAAFKVTVALERIVLGHTSAIKPLGEGVFEFRINFGPGYRIYFGKDGGLLIILIGGGTKQRQHKDIAAAKAIWKQYKHRKQQGGS